MSKSIDTFRIRNLLLAIAYLDPEHFKPSGQEVFIPGMRGMVKIKPTECDRLIGAVMCRAIALGFSVWISQTEYGDTTATIQRGDALLGRNINASPAIALLEAWVAALKNTQEDAA